MTSGDHQVAAGPPPHDPPNPLKSPPPPTPRPKHQTVLQEFMRTTFEEKRNIGIPKERYNRPEHPINLPTKLSARQATPMKMANIRAQSLAAQGKMAASKVLAAQGMPTLDKTVSSNPSLSPKSAANDPNSMDSMDSSTSSYNGMVFLPEYDFPSISASDMTAITGNPFDEYGSNFQTMNNDPSIKIFSFRTMSDNNDVAEIQVMSKQEQPTPTCPSKPHANPNSDIETIDTLDTPMHPTMFSRLYRQNRGIPLSPNTTTPQNHKHTTLDSPNKPLSPNSPKHQPTNTSPKSTFPSHTDHQNTAHLSFGNVTILQRQETLKTPPPHQDTNHTTIDSMQLDQQPSKGTMHIPPPPPQNPPAKNP